MRPISFRTAPPLFALLVLAATGVAAAAGPATAPAAALLAAGDLVRVSILDLVGPGVRTTLSRRVDPDGKISLPVLGLVRIDGTDVGEAATAIDKVYKNRAIILDAGSVVARLETAANATVKPGPITGADHLNVRLWDVDGPGSETPLDLEPNPDGTVALPFVGKVKVVGLTEYEAEQAITKAYADKHLVMNLMVAVLRTAGPKP